MKRFITVLALMLIIVPMKAQDKESYADFKNKKKEQMRHFADSVKQDYYQFRIKANEEYTQFMRQRWEEYQSFKGEPMPEIPEPPQPFDRDKETPLPELKPFKNIITIPVPNPVPDNPIKPREMPNIPPTPSVPEFGFSCYGTACSVRLDNSLRFDLKDVSENKVADAWEYLSSEVSEVLLEDCLGLREELALGDWAYYCMLRELSDKYLGKNSNGAVLMRTYLMAQSGFDVRIGRVDNNLILLLPFDGVIYRTTYYQLDGEKYYVMDQNKEGGCHIFDRSFMDQVKVVSLRMSQPPKFDFKSGGERSFSSKRYPELKVKLSTNKNLMDFYDDYPKCVWTNYCWAGLSDEVKEKLYPVLRQGIEGKNQIEAANRLINFVQTAFEYQTDGQQFGSERSLFGDETFFYPYSDCEDRSILFSILVRDLLHLDVVLLHFPEHIATAVRFTEELNGSYFMMDGKKYYISDPTYIGADVGMCMPRYANTSPEVYKL